MRRLNIVRAKLRTYLKNIKFIILVGITLLLGVAIFNQQNAKLSQSPSPSPSKSEKQLLPSNLTDDKRFILNPPSAEASRAAKDKHMQIVAKLAKVGDILEIKDCQPNPLVLQVKQGSEFKIKNNDNVKHKIIFDEENKYKIPANGQLTIKADFKYGSGDYGYVCEGVGLVGFLHVTP